MSDLIHGFRISEIITNQKDLEILKIPATKNKEKPNA
jgi:hypothetical protein